MCLTTVGPNTSIHPDLSPGVLPKTTSVLTLAAHTNPDITAAGPPAALTGNVADVLPGARGG